MRLSLLLFSTCGLAAAGACCAQSVRSVPQQYPTIQSAIDASAAGDSVLVEPGVYRERVRFRGRDLTLISRGGPAVTAIDGGGTGTVVTFNEGESRAAVLDGFSITGGSHAVDAGGIHIDGASPTLRNNIVHDNLGGRRGHGISIVASAAALLHDNRIERNRSRPDGNGAGGGGGGGIGVHASGAVEIRGNRIVGNLVTRFSSGGGINLVDSGATVIVGNRIEGNRARLAGGGIAIHGSSSARIENNLILANALSEPGHGGGVHWLIMVGPRGPDLIGNTIVANHAESGAGIHADGFDSRARIINNLVVAPPGLVAIACGDFGDLQPPAQHHNIAAEDPDASRGSCDSPAALGPKGNLRSPPTFVEGSWRLAPGSVGIDAGDSLAPAEALDLEGRPRRHDGDGDGSANVDIGAFEGW